MMLLQKLMILSIILTSAPFEYSNSHTVKEAAEAIQLLKGISLLISQQRNSALNHIGGITNTLQICFESQQKPAN